jgi:hypothetical protein
LAQKINDANFGAKILAPIFMFKTLKGFFELKGIFRISSFRQKSVFFRITKKLTNIIQNGVHKASYELLKIILRVSHGQT